MSEPVKLPVVLPFNPSDVLLAGLSQALDDPLVRLVIAMAVIVFVIKFFMSAGTQKRGRRYRRYRPSYRY